MRFRAACVSVALLASTSAAFANEATMTTGAPSTSAVASAEPQEATAEPAPDQPPTAETPASSDEPPTAGDRMLAGGAAVVPGLVVHGAGHFVAGESSTATKLLIAQGVGLGMVFGAGTVIVLTGASRYFVGPGAAVVILGVGVFGASFAADLYGALAPDTGAAATRGRPPPFVETELGYRHVADPLFDWEHFVYQRVSMQTGRLRFTPSAWSSVAGDNARYRAEGGYRLLGATPSAESTPVAQDRLELVLGLVHHRYPTERFNRSSVELAADARYDLGHLGTTLRGAFVEGGVGYSLARIDYDVPGVDVPSDDDDMLLGRLGFGFALRGLSRPGSEWLFYYDHRHDDLTGGLVMEGLGSGVAGHFGTEARWFFDASWGIRAGVEAGAAWVTGLSLLFRQKGAGFGSKTGE